MRRAMSMRPAMLRVTLVSKRFVAISNRAVKAWRVFQARRAKSFGSWSNLSLRYLEMKVGEWHELKIVCRGNKIRSWFNGREAIPELTDTSFASGRIGFSTKSDSVCRFADTRINYTPREPLAAALVRDCLKTSPRLVGLKIYVSDEKGEPRIIASKDAAEVGVAGGDSERGAIAGGHVYYGKEKDTVSVVQPLRDRNGEPIAAVRVVMKPYPGQIEQAVLQRANPIVKEMQARVQSLEELR